MELNIKKALKKAKRFMTLEGNAGKCPECGKLQYVEDIPELLKLPAGKWKNAAWTCTACKADMETEDVIEVPENELNRM